MIVLRKDKKLFELKDNNEIVQLYGVVIGPNFSFTGQVRGGQHVQPYSATLSFNLNNGNIQKTIFTGSVTSLSLTNKQEGGSYRIILQQGGSGSYTLPIPDATFGTRSDNSVDDSGGAGSWEPTSIGSKIIYDVTVDPDGDTFYTIETITI